MPTWARVRLAAAADDERRGRDAGAARSASRTTGSTGRPRCSISRTPSRRTGRTAMSAEHAAHVVDVFEAIEASAAGAGAVESRLGLPAPGRRSTGPLSLRSTPPTSTRVTSRSPSRTTTSAGAPGRRARRRPLAAPRAPARASPRRPPPRTAMPSRISVADRVAHRQHAPGEDAVERAHDAVAHLDRHRPHLPVAVARAGRRHAVGDERDPARRRSPRDAAPPRPRRGGRRGSARRSRRRARARRRRCRGRGA